MVIAALALAAAGAGPGAASSRAAEPIALGVFLHNSYDNPGLYDRYARQVGRKPAVIGSYKTWSIPAIDRPRLDAIWSRGALPMVTWEPWGADGRVFSLADIAAGRYDRYVNRSAAAAAAWGKPLYLRFAHEMNGAWYPWGRGTNGNTPRLYIAAWRHLVRIFRASGADNVIWVWAPNQNFSGRFPFRQYYPGDRWVDWVGLDGFNWARSPRWQSFTEIFAGSYNAMIGMTAKPMMVAETGSWEHGGSKAEWVTNALTRELPMYDHVRALVWWSVEDPRGDLRIDSSSPALGALRAAVSSPRYSGTREQLLSTPPTLATAAPVAVAGRHISVSQRFRRELKAHSGWIGAGLLGACLLAMLLAVAIARYRRPRSARHGASI